ncbi:MAG: hypothetical protein ACOYON_13185 [Fimbriimonas sp.]
MPRTMPLSQTSANRKEANPVLLRDALFNSPLTVIAGCVIWIPLAIWIVSMVHWMIMGEIEWTFGFLGIFLALMLGWTALNPPTPTMPVFTLAATVGTMIMFPFVRASLNRRELNSMEIEQVEKAYQSLALRPDNPLAAYKIAKMAYSKGFHGQALAVMETLIANLPKRHYPDEHRTYVRWKQTTPPDLIRPLPCVECGVYNDPARLHCMACGSPVLLDHIKGRFLGRSMGRKLVVGWLGMVSLLAGIPLASSLPPAAGILLILALLAGVGYAAWRAFGSEVRPT